MRRIHKRSQAPPALLAYRKTADPNRYLDQLRRLRPFPELLAIYEYWLEKKLMQR